MAENWEINWKDYYQILQVQPQAEPEVVKAAYDRLARKYHPDVNNASTASQRMKDLNEAFEFIGNPEKRTRYDLAYYSHHSSKSNNAAGSPGYSGPKPEIYPNIIRFSKVKRGEVQRGSFVITNNGGPFKRIQLYSTHNWIRIIRQTHLNPPDKFPLRIEFEAQGNDWDASYFNNFIVKLDNEEAQIRIELTTFSESAQKDLESKEANSGRPRSDTYPPKNSRKASLIQRMPIFLILLFIIIVSIVVWRELQPILNVWRTISDIQIP